MPGGGTATNAGPSVKSGPSVQTGNSVGIGNSIGSFFSVLWERGYEACRRRPRRARAGGGGVGSGKSAPVQAKQDLVPEKPVEITKPTAPDVAPKAPVVHWIEFVLEDDAGVALPNVAYEVKPADADVIPGVTDGAGKVRIDGLTAAACTVSFPTLHGPEWKKAG